MCKTGALPTELYALNGRINLHLIGIIHKIFARELFFLYDLSMKWFFWGVFFLAGCQPSTLADFRSEGKAWMISVITSLEKVQSKEDLEHMLPFLTKKYNEVADLIILLEKKHQTQWNSLEDTTTHSKRLQEQFERISLLPGARDILETAQLEALQALKKSMPKDFLQSMQ